jgi:WYL_2, Sm-like SH3 beta-barrel fold
VTYREIIDLLHEHDCEVTFTKVDGTVRVMPCTLREEAMPARDAAKFHETRVVNEKVISAFCLDKMEWRSFRVDNVTGIKVLNGS